MKPGSKRDVTVALELARLIQRYRALRRNIAGPLGVLVTVLERMDARTGTRDPSQRPNAKKKPAKKSAAKARASAAKVKR